MPRYARDEIQRAIDASRARHGADFPIWFLQRDLFDNGVEQRDSLPIGDETAASSKS